MEFVEHSEHFPIAFSKWTVPLLRAALDEHEQGIFTTSAVLADAMLRDDGIFTTLETRTTELLGAPFSLEPSKYGDQRMAKRVADDVWADDGLSGWWPERMPQSELAEHLRTFVMMGFSLAELPYAYVEPDAGGGGKHVPRLKVWSTQFVSYQQSVTIGRGGVYSPKWFVQTQDAGMIELVDDDPGWWLWKSSSARPWMNGAIRPLAIPFIIRQFALKDQGRTAEWAGQGVRKITVPRDAKPEDVAKYMRQVRQLANEPTVKCPEGWDFELLNAVASTGAADLFEKLLDRCETSFMRVLLGQDGTTQAQSGLNAGAGHKVLAKTELKRHEADARGLREGARRYVLMPYCEINEGHRAVAPFPKWDVAPPEDKKSKADTYNVLGDALGKLEAQGVDTDPIIEDFGLTKLTAAEAAKRAQAKIDNAPKLPAGSSSGPSNGNDQNAPPPNGKPPVPSQGSIAPNRAGVVALKAGRSSPAGFARAQAYVDDLVPAATGEMSAAMRPDVEAIIAILDGAEDFEGARAATTEAHASMDPTKGATVVKRALVMAEAAGRLGVIEDASE